MIDAHTIWNFPPVLSDLSNEATVEIKLVLPLLKALGYGDDDIAAKHPVRFQQGRVGRPAEADFAVFDGGSRKLGNCLWVIEAKRPKERFDNAQVQAESYAMYLRALVYLVTDGVSLEIWQYRVTTHSELVLKIDVSQIGAYRAQIEALLSRANLRSYRDAIREPSLLDVAYDVSLYLQAERARLERKPDTVVRTLSEQEMRNSLARSITCDDILDLSITSAVIYGRSGMGKSSVCARLHHLSVMKKQLVPDARLSVEVTLPDLPLRGKSLLDYAYERVSSHCVGMSRAMFNENVLNPGIDFFCDSFDRVPEPLRRSVELDFTLLQRDSPNSRFFVFSRSSSSPRLSAGVFYLQPLDRQQQYLLENSMFAQKMECSASFPVRERLPRLPPVLSQLAESPLVFSKVAHFYIENRKLPTNIVELFEFWLDESLRGEDHSPISYDRLVRALTVVAICTWDGSATVSEIAKGLEAEGLPLTLLDSLSELGVVVVSRLKVDIEHEALADLLRARHARTKFIDDEPSIAPDKVDRESFFPMLLLAVVTNPSKQRTLLTQLSSLGISGYMEAVRYRGEVTFSSTPKGHSEITTHVLSELVDGFIAPARMFFPELLPAIVNVGTGVHSPEIRAFGSVGEDLRSIEFSLGGIDQKAEELTYHHFSVVENAVNEARHLGMKQLHEGLHKVIASSLLKGGPVWREERLLSWLRLLLRKKTTVEASLNVDTQIGFWEKHRDVVVVVPMTNRNYRIEVSDILDDLFALKSAGKQELDAWWVSGAGEWWRSDWDESDEMIKTFYLRFDRAYQEVAEASFAEIKSDLRTFQAIPRSWDIRVTRDLKSQSRYGFKALWSPVRSNAESNVQISHSDRDFDRAEIYRWFETTSAQMSSLGRRATSLSYSDRFAPNFCGYAPGGCFDGKTAVLREVCLRLGEDIDKLFGDFAHRSFRFD